MVYWNTQEVLQALIGGSLIALASSLNLYFYGRITGLSGAFNSVVKRDVATGFDWKYCFLTGLLFFPVLFFYIFGTHIKFSDTFTVQLFDSDAYMSYNLNLYGWLLGGFLVGFGTKMGNGCTSGHGVCGIPRLSLRAILATLTFMTFGCGMATLRYYVPFFDQGSQFSQDFRDYLRWTFMVIFALINILYLVILAKNSGSSIK